MIFSIGNQTYAVKKFSVESFIKVVDGKYIADNKAMREFKFESKQTKNLVVVQSDGSECIFKFICTPESFGAMCANSGILSYITNEKNQNADSGACMGYFYFDNSKLAAYYPKTDGVVRVKYGFVDASMLKDAIDHHIHIYYTDVSEPMYYESISDLALQHAFDN